MNSDLCNAAGQLRSGAYTCVLCKDNKVITSVERGVKPLVGLLDSGIDLKGFSAADKVVGRAAAFLYVLLGVKEIYANVISDGAVYILSEHGIKADFDKSVKSIINRAGTGNCPMEEAVKDITEPVAALKAIRLKQKQLSEKSNE